MLEPILVLSALFALVVISALLVGLYALKTIDRLTSYLASVKSPEATLARGQVEASLEAARNVEAARAGLMGQNGHRDGTWFDPLEELA